MRNWNFEMYRQMILTEGLPDYLWGIETFADTSGTFKAYRSQTTYEELKPRANKEQQKLEHRSQTTYEELKLCHVDKLLPSVELPDYLWGIETRISEYDSFGKGSLPDYLWGIETLGTLLYYTTKYTCSQTTYEELKRESELATSLEIRAPRLPMRNWNLAT